MKLKKCAVPFLVGLFAAVTITSTASAHPNDYWQGKYIGKTGANIVLYVTYTAQTEILTKENVYNYATNWNNISSNVKVSVEYQNGIILQTKGKCPVIGTEFDSAVLGRTTPYDANGNMIVTAQGSNSNWLYSTIEINVDPTAFWGGSVIAQPRVILANAKKTFLHEVGHALKLSHPQQNSALSGHTVSNGRPYAIMNQGYVNNENKHVAADIAYHDKICLKTKWGA